MKLAAQIRKILARTPFSPVHIGSYIRELYFWKYFGALNTRQFVDILDAGFGMGEYAMKIAQKLPTARITGIDVEPRHARSELPTNVFLKKGNLLELEATAKYDFIYCIDVLEHIRDNRKVMGNFYRALKNDGYLYVHIPTEDNRYILPGRLFRDFEEIYEHEHVGEHYTLEELELNLRELGFTIVHSVHTFGLPGRLAWEIDTVTCKTKATKALRILLMPFLKILSRLSVKVTYEAGDGVLVLAKK